MCNVGIYGIVCNRPEAHLTLRAIHPQFDSLYGPLYSSAPNVLSPISAIAYYTTVLYLLFHTMPYYSILFHTMPYYSIIRMLSIYGIVWHTIPYYSIIRETGF